MSAPLVEALPSDAPPSRGAPCECELCRMGGPTRLAHNDASHDRRLVQDFIIGDRGLRIVGGTTKSARLLLGYALANPDAFRGRHVLELGAGAGLVAIGLGLALGCLVDATDQAPVLELLESNIQRAGAHARVRARILQWGEVPHSAGTSNMPNGKYAIPEIIVGADLNFARENQAALLATLRAHMPPARVLYLATQRRAPWEDELLRALAASFDMTPLASAGDVELHRYALRVSP